MNGVIDTVQWEGFREAVDDVRYVSTLKSAIDTVLQGNDNELKRIAIDAKAWLSTVNIYADLDKVRARMIEYILRLNGQSDDIWLAIGNSRTVLDLPRLQTIPVQTTLPPL